MEGLAELQQHGDHAAQHDRLGHRPDDHPGADAIHKDGRELGRLPRLGLPFRQPGEIPRRHQPRRRQQPHRHHPPAEHLPELPRHRPEQRDQRERPDPRDRRVHPLPLQPDQKAEPEGDRELEEGGGEHRGIVWRRGGDSGGLRTPNLYSDSVSLCKMKKIFEPVRPTEDSPASAARQRSWASTPWRKVMATDYILIWNDVALEANRVSHTDGSKEQNGPTLSTRRWRSCIWQCTTPMRE